MTWRSGSLRDRSVTALIPVGTVEGEWVLCQSRIARGWVPIPVATRAFFLGSLSASELAQVIAFLSVSRSDLACVFVLAGRVV